MLRCRSAESIRFFLASIDHAILWWRTHTQIEVYRKRNDSRHAIDLHAMSWILTPLWLAAVLLALVFQKKKLFPVKNNSVEIFGKISTH